MKLYDFLRKKTGARELCVITEGGWIVATAWIDYEDLFQVPKRLANMEVVKDRFDTLTVRDDAHRTRDKETVAVVPVRMIEVNKPEPESAFLIDVCKREIGCHDEDYTIGEVYSTFDKAWNYVDRVVKDISHRYPDAVMRNKSDDVVCGVYDNGKQFIQYTIREVGVV